MTFEDFRDDLPIYLFFSAILVMNVLMGVLPLMGFKFLLGWKIKINLIAIVLCALTNVVGTIIVIILSHFNILFA